MTFKSKFFRKSLLKTVLLIVAIGAIYYGINMKNQSTEKEPVVSSYDEMMNTPQIKNGKVLYDENCTSCHSINKTNETMLNKIVDSAYDKNVLYAFIRNGDSVLQSGNVYYNNLVKQYNNVRMTSFPNLTDSSLDNIMLYIKAEKIYQRMKAQ